MITKEEILESKTKSLYILEDDDFISNNAPKFASNPLGKLHFVNKNIFKDHFDKYNFLDANSPSKMGQFFLYEKLLDGRYKSNIAHDHELFYPKLGLYLNSLPCDQTIEIEWVDYRRTWESNMGYDFEYEGKKYQRFIYDNVTEIERLPIWHDYLLVYGVWDTMPNWRQLRQAYERTWWFHRTTDELRDLQLDRLLK